MTEEKQIVVEMRNVTKKFGDFTANENINLKLRKGEILALLGENGAGKSTLMNILYGLYQPTHGEIFINGKKTIISDPNVAIAKGIGMVHQHFMLVKPFTVAENIILGSETTKAGSILDMKEAVKRVKDLSEKYGLHVDPNAKIQDISVGMEQRVEILKLLYRGAEILILDEPTAVLTPQEIEELIKIMRKLTELGKSIIIISHKLKEIKQVCDYCTVIRRGKYIDTVDVSETSEDQMAALMVGRQVTFKVPKEDREPGEIALKIENLDVEDNRGILAVKGLNLHVKKGEILGLAGIDGNGQTELIEALTGLRKVKSGKILKGNKDLTNLTPKEIFESKVANIPEDRQKRGLVLDFSISENMVLENHYKKPFARKGVLQFSEINNFSKTLVEKFDVRPPDEHKIARELSGGNQQKVIIAREVTHNPDVLIAAQPTRGLDVGSIEFIHKSLVEQRDKGKAVLLISLELDEVMNVSDRICVIHEGRIIGEVSAKDATVEELGLMMAGGKE